MPYLGSENVSSEAQKPVELRGKLRNRFYEPIVLLRALTQACVNSHGPKQLHHAPDVTIQTPQQLFHNFMNDLAQICDNKRGGNTVTAVVALQYPDRVQFRFASNQRNANDLNRVQTFIKDILDSLKNWTTSDSEPVLRAKLLRQVIKFNQPRLQLYVRAIQIRSQECLSAPSSGITTETRKSLEDLQNLAIKADDRSVEGATFIENCTELMKHVKDLSKSETYRILRDKAHADNGHASDWAELRHAAGRLLSYFEGVKTLVEARKHLERLFDEFEVVWLPSSRPHPNPVIRKNATGEDIIGRMTSDPATATANKALVQDMQKHDLDRKIQDLSKNPNFNPIVHAEVLVHHSITNDSDIGSLHPTKFFKDYMYIGCSKPACRLCHYYFEACADDVQTRQTHKNIYPSWRAPDVSKGQGEQAVKRRENILNKMLVPIRDDAFRTLAHKVSDGRPHDSNTDPTYMHGSTVDRGDWDDMEKLSLEDIGEEDQDSSRSTPGGVTKSDEETDEPEDYKNNSTETLTQPGGEGTVRDEDESIRNAEETIEAVEGTDEVDGDDDDDGDDGGVRLA